MFNKTQYKVLIQQYMKDHDNMDFETAEKMFNKILIQQYMDEFNVSYTKAIHLISIDQILDYNISIY